MLQTHGVTELLFLILGCFGRGKSIVVECFQDAIIFHQCAYSCVAQLAEVALGGSVPQNKSSREENILSIGTINSKGSLNEQFVDGGTRCSAS